MYPRIKQSIEPLNLIFPEHRHLRDMTTKIIEPAIALANEFSQERDLFHCYFIEAGRERLDLEGFIEDNDEDGPIMLCTFPGLARKIRHNGKVQ